MKIKSLQIIALLVVFIAGISLDAPAQAKGKKVKSAKKAKTEKIELFNGKDLNNWNFHLRDRSVNPANVFTIRDGVINITGNPYGYMRTKETYSDYTLHLEWRWPGEATNSGVFIHMQVPDTIWPKSIECQLKAGNAGDFNCVGGSDMSERTDKSVRVVKRVGAPSEKPTGEWNIMEVVCKANTIELLVNGIFQNKATGVSVNKGSIGLQSEGKDIQFRNIFLTIPEKK